MRSDYGSSEYPFEKRKYEALRNFMFKETGSIISSDPPCIDGALPDLQQYPWNLNLFKSDGR